MDLTALPAVSIHNRVALPNDSAVYFITGPDYIPLYIGESVRLKNRWEAHEKKAAAIGLGADRILWLAVDEDDRMATEDRLIRSYNPPLNLKHRPRGSKNRPPPDPPAP